MVFQRSLPELQFEKRIKNEINKLDENGCKVERENYNLNITFFQPAYYRNILDEESCQNGDVQDNKPEIRNEHKIQIKIPRSYPFEPIDSTMVTWLTPIFHPNINVPPPDGNGFICLQMLKQSNISNLHSFIEGLKLLLCEPNLKDPLSSSECRLAQQYFEKHPESLEVLKQLKPSDIGSDILIIDEPDNILIIN